MDRQYSRPQAGPASPDGPGLCNNRHLPGAPFVCGGVAEVGEEKQAAKAKNSGEAKLPKSGLACLTQQYLSQQVTEV